MNPMKPRLVFTLTILVIIESSVIAFLVVNRTHFVVKKTISPLTIEMQESPIALAAKYDASDKKFEEVVKHNLNLLKYRPFGDKSFAILAECAYQRQTNYVRILIENGADVAEAIRELNPLDTIAKDAINLIQQIQIKSGHANQ